MPVIVHIGSQSKYGNVQTLYRGYPFDSQLEAEVCATLDMMGVYYRRQVPFVLWDKERGKRERRYYADFYLATSGGGCFVIDAKGVVTDEFSLKKRRFEERYPRIPLVIVRNAAGDTIDAVNRLGAIKGKSTGRGDIAPWPKQRAPIR